LLVVTEIDEYSTVIGGQTFRHIDYILETDDGDKITLRLNPVAKTDPYAKKHCDVLVLFPDWEQEFDENLLKNVLSTGTFEVLENGEVVATYHRIGENKEPYSATVRVVDKPGQIPRVENFKYWDYVRDVEGGTQEFYFVEMSEETGWFQMFKGVLIFEEDVKFLRKKVDA
ncbi:MAG: hypothetical protein AAB527_02300, partial [Patescibacteria group bacterium]